MSAASRCYILQMLMKALTTASLLFTACLAMMAQAPAPPASGQPGAARPMSDEMRKRMEAMTPEQRAQMRASASQPQPAPKDDSSFVAIFDGKSLNNWEGDMKHWRVENGVIVGETTTDNPIKQNTFLIWKGGKPADFELKLEYKLSAQGNSGVQYRSDYLTDRQFGLKGYQADIDADNRYTGQIYEEGARGFLALRGQFNRIDSKDQVSKLVLETIGDNAQLATLIKKQDWNEIHLVARGNTIIQSVNGQVMSALIDDDAKGRKMDGVLGLQLHVGAPMRIEFRNVRLKTFNQ